jgi:hypothetical protein
VCFLQKQKGSAKNISTRVIIFYSFTKSAKNNKRAVANEA